MSQIEEHSTSWDLKLAIVSFAIFFVFFFFTFSYFFPPVDPLSSRDSTKEVDFSTEEDPSDTFTPLAEDVTEEPDLSVSSSLDKESIIAERNKKIAQLDKQLQQEKNQRDSIQLASSYTTQIPHKEIAQLMRDKLQDQELLVASRVHFLYDPVTYEQEMMDSGKLDILSVVLHSTIFSQLSNSLQLIFFQSRNDVRAKFKNWGIRLFAPHLLSGEELVSVVIHEMGHFVDVQILNDGLFWDKSLDFYWYSWEVTKVMSKWQIPANFVSGYAMTNKYEDFAESYVFFVLHNRQFLQKASENPVLQRKYDFFIKNVFRSGEFQDTDFTKEGEEKDYYWDITKININLEKFLEYLEKWL